jgi:hypothetical protein
MNLLLLLHLLLPDHLQDRISSFFKVLNANVQGLEKTTLRETTLQDLSTVDVNSKLKLKGVKWLGKRR